MQALSIFEGRDKLIELREKVVADQDQVILTHESGNIVLISMDEWNAYQETRHLLRDKKTLQALLQSFEDHDKQKTHGKSVNEVFSDLA